MTELNMYAAQNFSYDFSQDAYLTKTGLSSDPDPDELFEYTALSDLSCVSVILCSTKLDQGSQIHASVLDQNNLQIPGVESQVAGSTLKSRYVFDTPISPETTIRIKVSSNISGNRAYLFCNATITKYVQPEPQQLEPQEAPELESQQPDSQ